MSHGFRTGLLVTVLVGGWNASAQTEAPAPPPEATETFAPTATAPESEPEPEAKPSPPPPKAAKKPVPPAKEHVPAPVVERQAKAFFEALLAGNANAAVSFCNFPFMLEDRTFKTSAELSSELGKQIQNKRTDLLSLGAIEVLAPADAEKKYGKPPARLSKLPYRANGTYVVVARLSGHAAVAIFQESGTTYQAIAYHD